jgi:ribose 5-phosphate isomerase A
MIHALAERVKAGLRVRGVPTSKRSHELATRLGIPLVTFDDVHEIDVTIDGADELDPELVLIKGGGGALLREKIVASASRTFVVVADASKRVATLGRFPLPVEVIGFAGPLIAHRLAALGGNPVLRRDAGGGVYITDEGHHILDCRFGAIADPRQLARTLDAMPGVVEHGLFIDMASVVIVAEGNQVTELRRS